MIGAPRPDILQVLSSYFIQAPCLQMNTKTAELQPDPSTLGLTRFGNPTGSGVVVTHPLSLFIRRCKIFTRDFILSGDCEFIANADTAVAALRRAGQRGSPSRQVDAKATLLWDRRGAAIGELTSDSARG